MPLPTNKSITSKLSKADFEDLAEFRYQLRRFLRFSERVTKEYGVTPLQYQLMLQVKGFPGRDWATLTELAERLQAQHHGVVALVSRCKTLGLVERRAGLSDLRLVQVCLTPAGEKCLEQLAILHRDELTTLEDILARNVPPGRSKKTAR